EASQGKSARTRSPSRGTAGARQAPEEAPATDYRLDNGTHTTGPTSRRGGWRWWKHRLATRGCSCEKATDEATKIDKRPFAASDLCRIPQWWKWRHPQTRGRCRQSRSGTDEVVLRHCRLHSLSHQAGRGRAAGLSLHGSRHLGERGQA